MAQVRLVSVVLAVIALLMLSGCAQLLPPGWNNTAQSPTTAVSADIAETDQDVAILDETDATDTVLDEEPETAEAAPVVPNPADSALPRKNVVEGELVSFPNLQAVDPDGDPIAYTFTPPLDAAGKWQTKVGDAGEYRVTITASDGKNSVSQVVIVQVDAKNKAPTIALASKDIVVKEGETVSLGPQVSDSDGDEVTLTISGWMTASSKQTTFTDAGTHDVVLSATDGTATVKETVRVTVQNVNRAPAIDPMGDVAVKEGDTVTIAPTSTDPDGDKVSYTFSAPITADGTWQTGADDVGRYTVEVTASDGDLTAVASFQITVESLNKAPIIQIADLVTVDEGKTVTLAPAITDPEGDELTISYSGWMNANTYKTDYEDAGTHIVTITASDGINTVKKDVTVTVSDQNRPPVFGQGSFN